MRFDNLSIIIQMMESKVKQEMEGKGWKISEIDVKSISIDGDYSIKLDLDCEELPEITYCDQEIIYTIKKEITVDVEKFLND